jgi:hypothetical protein
MAVKIKVEFFWAVTPCSVEVGYQRFGDRAASIFRVETRKPRLLSSPP